MEVDCSKCARCALGSSSSSYQYNKRRSERERERDREKSKTRQNRMRTDTFQASKNQMINVVLVPFLGPRVRRHLDAPKKVGKRPVLR